MNKLYSILIGVFGLLAVAADAWAQLPKKPSGEKLKLDNEWIVWVAMLVLLGGVVVAGFKSSKRSHLD